jgi:PIN domain nuclease of toxin-antitoxin system
LVCACRFITATCSITLAAQALEEELAITSADPIFRRYGTKQIW